MVARKRVNGNQNRLFDTINTSKPLAERLRPKSLDEVVGQDHLLGKDGLIRKMVKSASIRSMIMWGPPGTGKTTLASIIASSVDARYVELNAISAGVKELRQCIEEARNTLENGRRTILFIDEIHRFNKAQQAALLKSVEDGTLILLGATTENPSFEVITPLLSRCLLVTLYPLEDYDLDIIIDRAFEKDGSFKGVTLTPSARKSLKAFCGGDARVMLNALELALVLSVSKESSTIDSDVVEEAYQTQHYQYDKSGDEHYNTISAFIKSVRGSDPDAAVYYLARMLESGEDPKFIARRLIILASEDIGNAEPFALTLATSCFEAVNFVGMPEARIILSQCTTFLASSPKSNSSYVAINRATKDVREKKNVAIPLHLRNAPTDMMRNMNYGKGYKYAHNFEGNFVTQQYMPSELEGRVYYEPTENGKESRLKKFLRQKWKDRY